MKQLKQSVETVWGSSEASRKCHLISWEKICQPKDQGGIGFRNLKVLNKAYMTKLAWQMINNPEKLRVQIMKTKYNCGPSGMPMAINKPTASNAWRAIVSSWDTLVNNTSWIIRNGQNTRFWKDHWIPNLGSLEEMFPSVCPVEERNYPVSFYATELGWKWNVIERYLPQEICNQIANVQAPTPGITDFPSWMAASDGLFSLKSAYFLLSGGNASLPNPIFSKIWKWQGPARIRATLWKVAHGKLLTNEERKRRGMTNENYCPRCNSQPEDLMHLLRDCEEVQDLWKKHIKQDLWSKFFSLGQYAWFDWNLAAVNIGQVPWKWPLVFGIAIWAIWKDRKSLVFSHISSMGDSLWSMIFNHAHFIENSSVNPLKSRDLSYCHNSGSWKKPPHGVFKLNVDGSHGLGKGSLACGGLIRDAEGNFIKGFHSKITSSNVIWAELWGVLSGLQLARNIMLQHIVVEVDSKTAIDTINKGFSTSPALQYLIEEIKTLVRKRDWSVEFHHILRSANSCADHLAHRGHAGSFFLE